MMINKKVKCSQNCRAMISTTCVIGLCDTLEKINSLICENLPFGDQCSYPIVSVVLDMLNLPKLVAIQEEARVMFLNNRLFEHNICNGTIGVITKVIDNDNVEVTFPTNGSITKIKSIPQTLKLMVYVPRDVNFHYRTPSP